MHLFLMGWHTTSLPVLKSLVPFLMRLIMHQPQCWRLDRNIRLPLIN